MSLLILSDRRIEQPQVQTSLVDRGIAFLPSLSGPIGGYAKSFKVVGSTIVHQAYGNYITLNRTSLDFTKPFYVVLVVRRTGDSNGSWDSLISLTDGTQASWGINCAGSGTLNALYADIFNTSNTQYYTSLAATPLSTSFSTIVVSFGASGITLYRSDAATQTVSTTGTARFNSGSELRIGSRKFGIDTAMPAEYALAAVINGVLPAGYAKSLLRNPWQIFEPEHRYYYVSITGSGGNTYNVDISVGYNNETLIASLVAATDNLALSVSNNIVDTNNILANNETTLGQNQIVNTASNINCVNTIGLSATQDVSTASALQATGSIQVSLEVGSIQGISSDARISINDSVTITTNVEALPLGNLNTSASCTFTTTSTLTSAGGFSISESLALAMQSSTSSTIQLEISGTVSLTTSLEQAIATNALINGQVALTSTLAENIVATLIANEYVGVDFQILSTFMGTNPSVLARIGTQEILFTIATSKLHFINSGKDTLFTSS